MWRIILIILILPFTYTKTEWKRPRVEIQYDLNYTEIEAIVTAYNTVPEQTDGNPCIAAGGYICGRDDVVACPVKYPLGTRVNIAGKMYECLDRTAPKYGNRFDISFDKDLEGARNWGKKLLSIKIYE